MQTETPFLTNEYYNSIASYLILTDKSTFSNFLVLYVYTTFTTLMSARYVCKSCLKIKWE